MRRSPRGLANPAAVPQGCRRRARRVTRHRFSGVVLQAGVGPLAYTDRPTVVATATAQVLGGTR